MVYIDEQIKNTYRVPQPEGRGAYIRLDQNENPDGVPKWLFDSVMEKLVGVPTTFFVDSEGNCLCDEVLGADVQAYKETVESLK